ncbi:MAG: protease B nonderepressible form [Thelocarpon impressellum]|nr:MAG: protease B nonderepressible form [Thelocarpon impressellum]
MRQRTTFIHDGATEFNPQDLRVARDSLVVKNLKAAREDRLSFALHELPPEQDTFISGQSSFYFHRLVSSPDHLVSFVQQKLCAADPACHHWAASLLYADYVDITHDEGSDTLICSAFWDHAPTGAWNEKIRRLARDKHDKVEVGVLASEKAADPAELSLGGWLTVIGEDDKPNPSCSLHTYVTLPSALFVDRYQLSDPLLLASKNLHAIRALSGATDLEAPDWVVDAWGSALLAEIAVPEAWPHSAPFEIDIPLHLRYLPPAANTTSGTTSLRVPWPVLFWACRPSPPEHGINPFDRQHLGYDALLGPWYTYHHLHPVPRTPDALLVETIAMPVLNLQHTRWVESGTVLVVVLAFAWVSWKLVQPLSNRVLAPERRVAEGKKRA